MEENDQKMLMYIKPCIGYFLSVGTKYPAEAT